jgi:hypothetical protein
MKFAKIVDSAGRPAFRSYRSTDGAYQILFHANANRPGGGYGAWGASRLVGPYPLATADAVSGFKTKMRECIAWCAANAERIPAPPGPATSGGPTDTVTGPGPGPAGGDRGHGRSVLGQS